MTDRIEKYDYKFSITVNQINFLMGLLDSLGLIFIIKVFLFFFCVLYERRYFDVNFDVANVQLRYSVFVIVIIKCRQARRAPKMRKCATGRRSLVVVTKLIMLVS